MGKNSNKAVIGGALATILATTIAEVTPPAKTDKPKSTAKRIPMARVFGADGLIALVHNGAESVKTYVDGFLKLPVRARAGYDNFWSKEDGFTNAVKFRTLTAQGVGKMLAVLNYQAERIIAQGGENATTMTAILKGLKEYQKTARIDAAHEVAQDALNATFDQMVTALDGDRVEAHKRLAQYATENELVLPPIEAPAAEVEADAEAPETTEAETEEVGAAAE